MKHNEPSYLTPRLSTLPWFVGGIFTGAFLATFLLLYSYTFLSATKPTLLLTPDAATAAVAAATSPSPCNEPAFTALSSPDNVSHWQAALKRIVLVIFYNNAALPSSFTVSLLRAIYGRVFMKVLFAAPEAVRSLGVRQLTQANVNQSESLPWYLYYAGLPSLFAQFPDADGLLWSNDDVVINYWNLASANKSRFWMPADDPFTNYRWVDLQCCHSDDSGPDWSRAPETRASVRKALAALPHSLQLQYNRSTAARPGQYTKHIADLAYFPRRHWSALAEELIPTFAAARVHSELAVAAMFLCLEPFSAWDPALNDMLYLWTDEERRSAPRLYSPTIAALHPWKLSHRAYGRLLLMHMKDGDPFLLKLLPRFGFKES